MSGNERRMLYRLLEFSQVYNAFQGLVGAERFKRTLVSDYIRPFTGLSVLDFGCGTAEILQYMPGVRYCGIEPNMDYVESARQTYGDQATFIAGDHTALSDIDQGPFDVVLAVGVLHHITDGQAEEFFEAAAPLLSSSGRVITGDGCFEKGQNPIARFLLSRDRGRHVRTREGYVALAEKRFAHVETDVRRDLLRIPYSMCIMTCHA